MNSSRRIAGWLLVLLTLLVAPTLAWADPTAAGIAANPPPAGPGTLGTLLIVSVGALMMAADWAWLGRIGQALRGWWQRMFAKPLAREETWLDWPATSETRYAYYDSGRTWSTLEPQVRDAVVTLQRKGYRTVGSGFTVPFYAGMAQRRLGSRDAHVIILEALPEQAVQALDRRARRYGLQVWLDDDVDFAWGASVGREGRYTVIGTSSGNKRLRDVKRQFDAFVATLPSLHIIWSRRLWAVAALSPLLLLASALPAFADEGSADQERSVMSPQLLPDALFSLEGLFLFWISLLTVWHRQRVLEEQVKRFDASGEMALRFDRAIRVPLTVGSIGAGIWAASALFFLMRASSGTALLQHVVPFLVESWVPLAAMAIGFGLMWGAFRWMEARVARLLRPDARAALRFVSGLTFQREGEVAGVTGFRLGASTLPVAPPFRELLALGTPTLRAPLNEVLVARHDALGLIAQAEAGEFVLFELARGEAGAVYSKGHRSCLSCQFRARKGRRVVLGHAHIYPADIKQWYPAVLHYLTDRHNGLRDVQLALRISGSSRNPEFRDALETRARELGITVLPSLVRDSFEVADALATPQYTVQSHYRTDGWMQGEFHVKAWNRSWPRLKRLIDWLARLVGCVALGAVLWQGRWSWPTAAVALTGALAMAAQQKGGRFSIFKRLMEKMRNVPNFSKRWWQQRRRVGQAIRAWWQRVTWRTRLQRLMSQDPTQAQKGALRELLQQLPMRRWDDALEEIGRYSLTLFRLLYEPLALQTVQRALGRIPPSSRPSSELPRAVDYDVYDDEADVLPLAEATWAWSRLLHAEQYRAAVERAVRDRWRPGARVLDVGAGTGVLYRLLPKPLRAHVVTSDLDPLALEYARLRGRGHRFELGTIKEIVRRRGRFDAIVSLELFDALPADQHAVVLQKMFDGLRPGGYAVVMLDQPGFDQGAQLLPRLQRIADEVLQQPIPTNANKTLLQAPLTEDEVARVHAAFESASGEDRADLAMLLDYHHQALDRQTHPHYHPSLFHPSGLNISALLTARLAVFAEAQGWQLIERDVLALDTPVPYQLSRPVTIAGALTFLTLRRPVIAQHGWFGALGLTIEWESRREGTAVRADGALHAQSDLRGGRGLGVLVSVVQTVLVMLGDLRHGEDQQTANAETNQRELEGRHLQNSVTVKTYLERSRKNFPSSWRRTSSFIQELVYRHLTWLSMFGARAVKLVYSSRVATAILLLMLWLFTTGAGGVPEQIFWGAVLSSLASLLVLTAGALAMAAQQGMFHTIYKKVLPRSVFDYWRDVRKEGWDRELAERTASHIHIPQREQTVAYLRQYLPPQATVVDLGTGTGQVARDVIALPHVSMFLGIDINPRVLESSRAWVRNSPQRDKLRLEQMNVVTEYQPAPESVDAFIALDILHHLPNPEELLTRIWTGLKRDGVIVGNFLGRERFRTCAVQKHGWFKYVTLTAVHYGLKALMPISWTPVQRVVERLGRAGWIRLEPYRRAEVIEVLERNGFEIEQLRSEFYHWFVAKKVTSSNHNMQRHAPPSVNQPPSGGTPMGAFLLPPLLGGGWSLFSWAVDAGLLRAGPKALISFSAQFLLSHLSSMLSVLGHLARHLGPVFAILTLGFAISYGSRSVPVSGRAPGQREPGGEGSSGSKGSDGSDGRTGRRAPAPRRSIRPFVMPWLSGGRGRRAAIAAGVTQSMQVARSVGERVSVMLSELWLRWLQTRAPPVRR